MTTRPSCRTCRHRTSRYDSHCWCHDVCTKGAGEVHERAEIKCVCKWTKMNSRPRNCPGWEVMK